MLQILRAPDGKLAFAVGPVDRAEHIPRVVFFSDRRVMNILDITFDSNNAGELDRVSLSAGHSGGKHDGQRNFENRGGGPEMHAFLRVFLSSLKFWDIILHLANVYSPIRHRRGRERSASTLPVATAVAFRNCRLDVVFIANLPR